jgi:hypothetical protein
VEVDRMTYQQLDEVLLRLGFSRDNVGPNWVRYEHTPSDTVIVLADKNTHELVRVTDAVSARLHLVEKGLITEGEMEAIVSRNASGQKAISATDS